MAGASMGRSALRLARGPFGKSTAGVMSKTSITAPSSSRGLHISSSNSTPLLASPRLPVGRALLNHRHASFKTSPKPVELSYDLTEPKEITAPGQSLVICHGLLGSKQNFRSLAKTFAQKLGMPVYTLDMRNHGSSPHVEPHSYEAMATDIAAFFEKHGLTSGVNLLGHSMGGKAVMSVALNDELNKPLRSLISIDMSPAKGKISDEFKAYTETMAEIEEAKVKTKSEADKYLQKVEPSLPTRQFLLTNALTTPAPNPTIKFRIPLSILTSSMPNIGDFPFDPTDPSPAVWNGPTLFLKGEHSKYLNRRNIPVAEGFFPSSRLEVLDAGHWVHAERPLETVRFVQEFLEGIE